METGFHHGAGSVDSAAHARRIELASCPERYDRSAGVTLILLF
jgi:hypothetical protein